MSHRQFPCVVPQFGLMDELTKLKEASDAEEALNQQQEIASEEHNVLVARRGSSFLMKKNTLGSLAHGPNEAVHELEDMVSEVNAANAGIAEGSESKVVDLDAEMAAAAKEATDKLTSMALKFEEAMYPPGTSLGFSPEEAEMHEKLRVAMSSGNTHLSAPNNVEEENRLSLALIDEASNAECVRDNQKQCPDGWTQMGTLCQASNEYSG